MARRTEEGSHVGKGLLARLLQTRPHGGRRQGPDAASSGPNLLPKDDAEGNHTDSDEHSRLDRKPYFVRWQKLPECALPKWFVFKDGTGHEVLSPRRCLDGSLGRAVLIVERLRWPSAPHRARRQCLHALSS